MEAFLVLKAFRRGFEMVRDDENSDEPQKNQTKCNNHTFFQAGSMPMKRGY